MKERVCESEREGEGLGIERTLWKDFVNSYFLPRVTPIASLPQRQPPCYLEEVHDAEAGNEMWTPDIRGCVCGCVWLTFSERSNWID
jgi:hypothetical protein